MCAAAGSRARTASATCAGWCAMTSGASARDACSVSPVGRADAERTRTVSAAQPAQCATQPRVPAARGRRRSGGDLPEEVAARVLAGQVDELELPLRALLDQVLVVRQPVDAGADRFREVDGEREHERRLEPPTVLPDRRREVVAADPTAVADLGIDADEVDRDASQGVVTVDVGEVE